MEKTIKRKSLMSVAVLLALTLVFSAIALSEKVYADEKAAGASQAPGTDIKITVTGDASLEPAKAAEIPESKDNEIKTDPTEPLPDIEIYIDVPEGYFSDRTTVTFRLKTKDGSMPKIKNVKAKTGKKGTYQDVTESMALEITEDCTVHVVATDTSGRTYERSRNVQCFDKEKPTLNASVSEGILEVTAKDTKSGVKSIIVNGYEYTDLKDGKVTIRLTQFDGGYEKFVIQATDIAGNKSDSYTVKNPYHKNKDSNSDYDPATELPESTEPTETGDATGEVTGHVKTDKNGNIVKETPGGGGNSDGGNADGTGNNDGTETGKDGNGIDIPDNLADMLGSEIIEVFLGGNSTPVYAYDESLMGREFYTITTESGKVFYLIIDRTSGKEVVRFLTDITEEDLLHVVKNSSQSLPRNSAAKDSEIPIQEAAISNNNTGNDGYSDTKKLSDEEAKGIENEQQETPASETPKEESFIKKNMSYIIMGVVAVIFIIAGYYFKVVKKRREVDDDETGESEEDETGKDSEDDYLGSDDKNK